MKAKYDLIVIGGGPGGYEGAIRAAQLGLYTALIEKDNLGGTCLNRGCIPTKTIMHTSRLYREARNFTEIGLSAAEVKFDMAKIQQRKKEVVTKLQSGIAQLLKANKVDVYQGKGMVLAPGKVQVTGEAETFELEAEKILIATGAIPARPPIAGLDLPGVFTSDDLLDSPQAEKVYNPLVIIGGGVIGVELASIYSDLGCAVTVIEALPRILPAMDREISQNLSMILKKRGVKIHTAAMVSRITEENGLLQVEFTEKEKLQTAAGDAVLVAIGRRPQTEGLFASGLNPRTEKGFLVVDEFYQTDIPGVYAAGDVIGGIQLAHAASAEALRAVEIIAGKESSRDKLLIPGCVYTDPEIATVGLTEEEAKAAGYAVKIGKCIMSANGKSLLENLDRGFIKLVFAADTEVLLGAHLMCGRATDLISELATAIKQKMTATQLAATVRPHPTFSEAITEAVESIHGQAIHIIPGRKN